jgi:CSLREA domain-containing protein
MEYIYTYSQLFSLFFLEAHMFTNKINPRVFPFLLNLAMILGLLLASAALPIHVRAANVITVTTTDDNLTDDGLCSLREAINNADTDSDTSVADCNSGFGYDTITFADGIITILLGSALPFITDADGLIIDGGSDVKLSGNNSLRVLNVSSSGVLFLQNITVINGNSNLGSGILNAGMLTITNSSFSANSSTGNGGGFANNPSGTAFIVNSTFSGNSAIADGGGGDNYGTLTVINSTFLNNSANYGGGLVNFGGTATILNSTFSGNNAVVLGGAISTWNGGIAPTTTIRNTILANSGPGGDCWNYSGSPLTGGNNIIETTSTCTSIATLSGDPHLGALAGAPAYFRLKADSPAINAGDDAICADVAVNNTSQNGVARPEGPHCDIGAVEYETSFADLSTSHLYWQDIEILYANGLTAGCSVSPLSFCPDQIMDRAQSGVFMLRGNYGTGYTPPVAPWNLFADDFSPGAWAEKWAEGMYNAGLTAGCATGPLRYCPWDQTPRVQAVVFGLRLKYGNAYVPPAASGTVFFDMTNPAYYGTKWAEQAYADGLLPNCGVDIGTSLPLFCPNDFVSRGLAAYMIVRAKNLSIP